MTGDTPVTYVRWRVFCEIDGCDWQHVHCVGREDAIRCGKWHIQKAHRDEDWQFRVQAVRVVSVEPSEGLRVQTIDNVTHEPHRWMAHPTSRNRGLPCGRCGTYQYLHDQIYGYDLMPMSVCEPSAR